ncbi:hypothetical protein P0D69_08600 [Paraburkholderia sediminicola]|uniref:hypothetical protein n=1 Tax=Paraburkholderia sediminicola TaxID=458836 RepID=UPI0038BB8543
MKSNFRNVMVLTAIVILTMGAAGCKRADNSSSGAGADAGSSTGAMSAPSAASGMSGGASGASQ